MKQPLSYQLVCKCLSLCILFSAACNNNSGQKEAGAEKTEDNTPPDINFKVVNSFSHDTTSYTEGLLIHNGLLFESTGHTNSYPSSRSMFGPVDFKNGRIVTKIEIDKTRYFGEGIAFLKDRVYQLTDTTHIGFVYDAKTYKKLGTFNYEGEGWGLTTNGTYKWLYFRQSMADG